jgi:hypothetical protein
MKEPWKFSKHLPDVHDAVASSSACDAFMHAQDVNPVPLANGSERAVFLFSAGFARGAQWGREKVAHVARPIVIVESPFAGNVELNLAYARAALHDCLLRGEAPFASHTIYTQPGVLDDTKPNERTLGIEAGFAFRYAAAKTVVYGDLGMSRGMQLGIEHAAKIPGHEVERRSLPGWAGVKSLIDAGVRVTVKDGQPVVERSTCLAAPHPCATEGNTSDLAGEG